MSNLFAGVIAGIVPNNPAADEKLKRDLTVHGATVITEDDYFNPNVTHIIASDIDFPEYHKIDGGDDENDGKPRIVNVVTPQWVTDSINHSLVQPTRQYSPDPRYIFSDIAVVAAGLQAGDVEAIYGGVRGMGGLITTGAVTKITTHVISDSLDHDLCRIALQHNIKVVLPHWIDDCLIFRRKLDDAPYLLPNPPYLKSLLVTDSSTDIPPSNDNFKHTFPPRNGEYDAPTASQRRDLFEGRLFALGSDLAISDRIRKSITKCIEQSGGRTVADASLLSKAVNVYIGKYRDQDEYLHYSQQKKCFVGSLEWLYWMLANDKWTSPYLRLLHYPVVRGGLPEAENLIIAVTNYAGNARYYLEQLIQALGATYTKTFKQGVNNLLIASRPVGDKYNAAREWKVPVVNHLWLEETYAAWRLLSASAPKYSHFLPSLNLSEVIGSTPLNDRVLRQFYVRRLLIPGRAAKSTAEERLHQDMEDKNLYDQQMKHKRHLEGVLLPEELEQKKRAKASKDSDQKKQTQNKEVETDGQLPSSYAKDKLPSSRNKSPLPNVSGITTPHKESETRSRHSTPTSATARKKAASTTPDNGERISIMLTKVDDSRLPGTTRAIAKELSVKFVENNGKYLVAPSLIRTEKFLCGLATVEGALSIDYIVDSFRAKKLLYPIEDKYKLISDEVLERRPANGLLAGYTINFEDSVKGGPAVYQRVASAHGAASHAVKSSAPKHTQFVACEDGKRAILAVTNKTSKLGDLFMRWAEAHNYEAYVVSTDWLFESIFSMKVELGTAQSV